MNPDEEHLRLLSIFHYVLGVFTIIVLMRESVKDLFRPPYPEPGL